MRVHVPSDLFFWRYVWPCGLGVAGGLALGNIETESRSFSAGSSVPISAGNMSLSNKTRVNILGALHSRLDGNHIKSGEA